MLSREIGGYAAQGGGHHDALFELGLSFCTGRDGTLDLVEAHKWFNIAAMRGNDEAKRYRLGRVRSLEIKTYRAPRIGLDSVRLSELLLFAACISDSDYGQPARHNLFRASSKLQSITLARFY